MIVSCYFQAKISWYFGYFQNINLYYYYLLTFLIHAYLTQTTQVSKLLDAAKILTKILTLWVRRNNVADDRHRRTAHTKANYIHRPIYTARMRHALSRVYWSQQRHRWCMALGHNRFQLCSREALFFGNTPVIQEALLSQRGRAMLCVCQ